MKLSLTLATVFMAPLVVMGADSEYVGNSKCVVRGFKFNATNVVECCLTNMGGSNNLGKKVECTLPIGKEGLFRKCVRDLGYATIVHCDY